jgi:DNA-directed RNA polymerase specialized sigma subunit
MSNEYLNNKSFEIIIIKYQEAQRMKQKLQLLQQDIVHQLQYSKNIRKPLKVEQQEISDAENAWVEAQKILATAFYTLSQNIVRYAKFSNIDEDDAVQEGVLICFERAEKFDPAKGKAFNYMTTCILNHFRQLWRSARNYQELKKRYSDIIQVKLGMDFINKRKDRISSKNFDRYHDII